MRILALLLLAAPVLADDSTMSFTPTEPGTCTITATNPGCPGVEGTATVIVRAEPPTETLTPCLTVSPNPARVGQVVTFRSCSTPAEAIQCTNIDAGDGFYCLAGFCRHTYTVPSPPGGYLARVDVSDRDQEHCFPSARETVQVIVEGDESPDPCEGCPCDSCPSCPKPPACDSCCPVCPPTLGDCEPAGKVGVISFPDGTTFTGTLSHTEWEFASCGAYQSLVIMSPAGDYIEGSLKILDGRPVNEKPWLYLALRTDLGFVLSVESDGCTVEYVNRSGAYEGVTDQAWGCESEAVR